MSRLLLAIWLMIVAVGCVSQGSYTTCPYWGHPRASIGSQWNSFNDQRACSQYMEDQYGR